MTKQIASPSAEDAGLLDLGVILGQNQTFSLIAGRCSAAQAASLQRLRKQKQYTRMTPQWSAFCTNYLKMSRAQADRLISLYEEFGPAYFEISQLTRVSPETYRALAPALKDGALHWNGNAIEITAENSHRIGEAVAQIRQAKMKKQPASSGMEQRIETLEERCTAFLTELREISDTGRGCANRRLFEIGLQRTHLELERLLRENGIR